MELVIYIYFFYSLNRIKKYYRLLEEKGIYFYWILLFIIAKFKCIKKNFFISLNLMKCFFYFKLFLFMDIFTISIFIHLGNIKFNK